MLGAFFPSKCVAFDDSVWVYNQMWHTLDQIKNHEKFKAHSYMHRYT